MREFGVFCVLGGVALFVLPLLKIHLSFLSMLGSYQQLTALVMVMIGVGICLFSRYE